MRPNVLDPEPALLAVRLVPNWMVFGEKDVPTVFITRERDKARERNPRMWAAIDEGGAQTQKRLEAADECVAKAYAKAMSPKGLHRMRIGCIAMHYRGSTQTTIVKHPLDEGQALLELNSSECDYFVVYDAETADALTARSIANVRQSALFLNTETLAQQLFKSYRQLPTWREAAALTGVRLPGQREYSANFSLGHEDIIRSLAEREIIALKRLCSR